MKSKNITVAISPDQGGRLMTRLSSERPGSQDYVLKRDWRRDLDQEIRREGHDYFYPINWHPLGNQPYPQNQPTAPAISLPITLIHQAWNPKGETAVVTGTETGLFVFYPNTPKPYHEAGATPDDDYFVGPAYNPGEVDPDIITPDPEPQPQPGPEPEPEPEPEPPQPPGCSLVITTGATLPGATKGADYFQTLAATGGTGVLTWTITSNSPWADIDPETGVLAITDSGISAGTYYVTVKVIDGAGCEDQKQFSIVVVDPCADFAISTPATLPSIMAGQALVGQEYLVSKPDSTVPMLQGITLTVDNGTAPFTWEKVSGPAWVDVSATGELTVNSAQIEAGNYTVVVRVTDANDCTVEKTLTLPVTSIPINGVAPEGTCWVLFSSQYHNGWDGAMADDEYQAWMTSFIDPTAFLNFATALLLKELMLAIDAGTLPGLAPGEEPLAIAGLTWLPTSGGINQYSLNSKWYTQSTEPYTDTPTYDDTYGNPLVLSLWYNMHC